MPASFIASTLVLISFRKGWATRLASSFTPLLGSAKITALERDPDDDDDDDAFVVLRGIVVAMSDTKADAIRCVGEQLFFENEAINL